MVYLDFVIEHSDKNNKDINKVNIFEKILVASQRARGLANDQTPVLDELLKHKCTSVAIYEINHNLIIPLIKDEKYKDIEHSDQYDDYDDEEEEGV